MTCVGIPGESGWVKADYTAQSRAPHAHTLAVPAAAAATTTGTQRPGAGQRLNHKHRRDEESEDEEMGGMAEPEDGVVGGEPGEEIGEGVGRIMQGDALKRARTSRSHAEASSAPASVARTHSSLPSDDTVFVHVYEEESALKVMDMVEFVGVYTLDPDHDEEENEHWGSSAIIGGLWGEAGGPAAPSARFPHLHAIVYRKLDHNHPALDLSPPGVERVRSRAMESREKLLALFSGLLHQDALSAEYLLLHLLSRVSSRHDDSSLVLGKLALNICGIASGMQPLVSQ